jgi:hypothetical protein
VGLPSAAASEAHYSLQLTVVEEKVETPVEPEAPVVEATKAEEAPATENAE